MKNLLLAGIILGVMLTGCGKRDVAYNQDDNGAAVEEDASGESLSEALGAGNTWQEQIGSGTDTIFVNAKVQIPGVKSMYTKEVSEHYYTPEEQKQIAGYFMDADTLKVNKEEVVTKEWLQKRINYCEQRLEAEEENDSAYKSPKEYLTMISNEKKRLEGLMDSAPSVNDVSETIKDFSENDYVGKKGEIEYTLSFDMDEATNTSYWKLEAADGNDFTDGEISTEYYFDWRVAAPLYEGDNLCQMTKEEAGKKAEQICQEIGLTGLKAVEVTNLEIFLKGEGSEMMNIPSDTWNGQNAGFEMNGYYVMLTREINGVPVANSLYHGDSMYLNTEETEKPYDREMVILEFNDKGIISMTCEGAMQEKATGKPVKLLSYEQVTKLFRQELMKLEEKTDTWRYLSLVYIRTKSEEDPNSHCYIPAWCLSLDKIYGGTVYSDDGEGTLDSTLVSHTIWINAIDGSRIDPDEAGFVHYITAQEELREMELYFDEE